MSDERSRLVEELERLRTRAEEIGQRLAEIDRDPIERVRLRVIKGGAAAVAGFLALAAWSRRRPVLLASAAAFLIAVLAITLPSEPRDNYAGRLPGQPPRPTAPPTTTPTEMVPGQEPPSTSHPHPVAPERPVIYDADETRTSVRREPAEQTAPAPPSRTTTTPPPSPPVSGDGDQPAPPNEQLPPTEEPPAPPDETVDRPSPGLVCLHVEVRPLLDLAPCLL